MEHINVEMKSSPFCLFVQSNQLEKLKQLSSRILKSDSLRLEQIDPECFSNLSILETFILEEYLTERCCLDDYMRIRNIIRKVQIIAFRNERKNLSSAYTNAFQMRMWLYRINRSASYCNEKFDSKQNYVKKRALKLYFGLNLHRRQLIDDLSTEISWADNFSDLETALFCTKPSEFKDQIDLFIFSSGETIYERDLTRRRWLSQLREMISDSCQFLIPSPSDNPCEEMDLTHSSYYINFLSKEITSRILYGGSDKSPIKCDKPILLYRMFRYLNKHGIIQIDKEETYKLVRIMFDLDSKYHARYPYEIPIFIIPEPKKFSTHFKSISKIIFEKGYINGSKNELSKILNQTFPIEGMSISMIVKSLKPASEVYLNDFTAVDLIAAMNSESVID